MIGLIQKLVLQMVAEIGGPEVLLEVKRLTGVLIRANRIFTDKLPGSHVNRQGLQMLRHKVEEGDVILMRQPHR